MKIIHIINNLNMGGGQNLLIGLAEMQQKGGNDVTVLQLKESPDKTVANKILATGVKVETMTVSGSLYNPVLIFRLIPVLKRYDIIHVHLFPSLYWVGFANLLSGKKAHIVYTEHSTKNKRRGNPILRRVDNFVYQHCYDKVIACADKALETYLQVYPGVKHVCAINNGVDTKKYWEAEPYTKQELLGLSDDSFVVTMVARFMFMKRQDTIVEAISKLPEKFHACFVGSEPTDEGLLKVKKLAEDLRVLERVHFLYIRPDVPRILKTSDVVMMASDYEGLSLSSIEGMAAGKPFIATDVNGLREVVAGAGELFENKNSDQLAAILANLESDKGYYDEMVTRCRQRASEYDIQGMVDKYMNEYEKVIKK